MMDWEALRSDVAYDLERREWRQLRWRLRDALCELGLHWPIEYHHDLGRSYSAPGEPGWACSRCLRERLPYRSVFWRQPFESMRWFLWDRWR